MTAPKMVPVDARTAVAFALADDAFVLSERTSELLSSAPTLEEELSLANIALDLLGQARAFYACIAPQLGDGLTEDDLVYGRSANEFHNAIVFELPNYDFAHTLVRLAMASEFFVLRYSSLATSLEAFGDIAGVAVKAAKEVHYHRDHTRALALRLATATPEGSRRMTQAWRYLAPYWNELFEEQWLTRWVPTGDTTFAAVHVPRETWDVRVVDLAPPLARDQADPRYQMAAGRHGAHTEHLVEILQRLNAVRAMHPGGAW